MILDEKVITLKNGETPLILKYNLMSKKDKWKF